MNPRMRSGNLRCLFGVALRPPGSVYLFLPAPRSKHLLLCNFFPSANSFDLLPLSLYFFRVSLSFFLENQQSMSVFQFLSNGSRVLSGVVLG